VEGTRYLSFLQDVQLVVEPIQVSQSPSQGTHIPDVVFGNKLN
jgi:hypothetical protein